MRKIYSLVLMTAMLFIGATAWANTYTIGMSKDTVAQGKFKSLASFMTKVDNGTVVLTSADEITLLKSQTLVGREYNFGGAAIHCQGYSFNVSSAITATIKNAVMNGTNYMLYVYKSGQAYDVTINLDGVSMTTTSGYPVYLRNLNTTLNIASNCSLSGATYTICVAAATMNITNNASMDWSICPSAANALDHVITNNAGNLAFHSYDTSAKKSFTGNVSIANEGSATVSFPKTMSCSLNLTNVTIADGTFNGVLSGSDITVTGGTFTVAPAAEANGTIAGECKFPAGPAIGGLTIDPGYKGFANGYIYARTTQGYVVRNERSTLTYDYLEDAFAAAQNGDVITLLGDVTTYETIWMGTTSVNGTPKSLTLDLNGHSITSRANVKETFILSHGALSLINSVPGEGGIYNNWDYNDNKGGNAFLLHGTWQKTVNTQTAEISDLFTYLSVGEGVNIHADGVDGSCISINELYSKHPTVKSYGLDYSTDVYGVAAKAGAQQPGVANGVRVDVKGNIDAQKYGVKINGQVRSPQPEYIANSDIADYRQTVFPTLSAIDSTDVIYSPFVHIYSSAIIATADNQTSATAVYASGFGRWLIEGTCTGNVGVYVKSGDVAIDGATIESTASEYTSVVGKGSGIDAAGSAIVIESNKSYSGESSVTVTGDTKVNAETGYAVEEVVTTSDTTKVSAIAIESGTFEGGTEGCIAISQQTLTGEGTSQDTVTTTITIAGATVDNDPETIALIETIGGDSVFSTTTTNEQGQTIVVISQGEAPVTKVETINIDTCSAGSRLNLVAANGNQTVTADTVKLAYLSMVDATPMTLTIDSGSVLVVDQVVMGTAAQIIVKAGAKLIIEGNQGLVAPVASNLIIEAQDDNMGMFLFNPTVNPSNKTPNGTVNLISRAYRKSDGDYVWQRFGVPAVEGIYRTDINYPNASAIKYWSNEDQDWYNVPTTMVMKPFMGFGVTTQQPTSGDVYSMASKLVGCSNANLSVGHGWNYFANSYTADMDIKDLLLDFMSNYEGLIGAVEVNVIGTDYWNGITLGDLEDNDAKQSKLDPMQAFLVNMYTTDDVVAVIDYENVVWNHRKEAKVVHAAPARANGDITKVVINITSLDNNRTDAVTLRQAERFSEDFDNGYEMPKYMMESSFNVYVNTDFGSMEQMASNDIMGQGILLNTAEETTFKMTFTNIRGEELAIRDNVTGTVMNITPDAEYFFTAGAYTNEKRFEIVGRQEMPTEMETVESQQAVKAVYNVQGQYMGETTEWNALPHGVYVVDGVKMVK